MSQRALSRPSRFAVRFIETYRAEVATRSRQGCRFEPNCSRYGLEAYRKYGFVRATAKTVWRILRCNPLARGGKRLDPA